MTPVRRETLLEIAAECEARAGKAAADRLAHKRRMLQLRQRAAVLREMASPQADYRDPTAAP